MSQATSRGGLRSPDCQAESTVTTLPYRRSVRLSTYDYSQPNAYFVTICTANRRCLFGTIVDDIMQLNAYGRIVEEEWLRIPQMRPAVSLDEFIVMPNHLHALVVIVKETNAAGDRRSPRHGSGPSSGSLGSMIGGFKSASTGRINQLRTGRTPIWQRNYYEHVIRSEKAHESVGNYILANPTNWHCDRENPSVATQPKMIEPWHR